MNMEFIIVLQWAASLLAIVFAVWALLYTELVTSSASKGMRAGGNKAVILWVLAGAFGLLAFLGGYFFDYTVLQRP